MTHAPPIASAKQSADRDPQADDITVVIVAITGRDASVDIADSARVLHAGVDGMIRDAQGRVVHAGTDRSVPRRRELAARCAKTPFVAFLENTVTTEPGWLQAAVFALRRGGVAAAGGPVLVSPVLPAIYRALGLTEYARFHPANIARLEAATTPAGVNDMRVLPGCNFAFRTDALLAALDRLDGGLIDNEVFAELHRQGHTLAWHPDMAVTYDWPHDAGARLHTRFRHGRLYASRLHTGLGPARRFAGMLKASALPLVLFRRTLVDALRSRQATAGALMWAAAMHLAWSMGEFAGAARGAAQDEVGQWT